MNNLRILELAGQSMEEDLNIQEFIDSVTKNPKLFYVFTKSELSTFVELILKEPK